MDGATPRGKSKVVLTPLTMTVYVPLQSATALSGIVIWKGVHIREAARAQLARRPYTHLNSQAVNPLFDLGYFARFGRTTRRIRARILKRL